MGFEFYEPRFHVGQKWVIVDPEGAMVDDPKGHIATITAIDEDESDWGGYYTAADGKLRYMLNKDDIDDGYIRPYKEEDVGLQLPTEPQAAQVQVKHPELDKLEQLVHLSRTEPGPIRQDIMDCINQRYRSTAYRDMIKKLVSGGGMSPQDRDEMQKLLSGIRHCVRTPRAKAYR